MKKILSISVVALLAMVPTMGWAVDAGNTGAQEYQAMPSDDNPLTKTSTYAKGTNATGGYIVSTTDPLYNVVEINENDGKHAAAVSYVKGAYNDLIEKINKVSDQESEVDDTLTVYTTWGGTATEPIARVQSRYGTTTDEWCDTNCTGLTDQCSIDRADNDAVGCLNATTSVFTKKPVS